MLAIFACVGMVKGAGLHSLFLMLNMIASPAVSPVELSYPPFRLGTGAAAGAKRRP